MKTGKITVDPKKLKTNIVYNDAFKSVIDQLKSENDTIEIPKKWYQKMFYNPRKKEIENVILDISNILIERKNQFSQNELKKTVKDTLNLVKKRGLLDIEGWKREFKDAKYPGRTFMVNMELRNGMHTHFMVELKWKCFDYEDGRYIIDDEYKYYDVDSKIYCLDYHQDCCLPLKRRFQMNLVMDAITQSGDIDTETSIDPKSLKIFMESDIIQKVMQGAEMEQWTKFVKIMLIVITGITGLILLGMLKIVFSK
jgi:hypothetical protein